MVQISSFSGLIQLLNVWWFLLFEVKMEENVMYFNLTLFYFRKGKPTLPTAKKKNPKKHRSFFLMVQSPRVLFVNVLLYLEVVISKGWFKAVQSTQHGTSLRYSIAYINRYDVRMPHDSTVKKIFEFVSINSLFKRIKTQFFQKQNHKRWRVDCLQRCGTTSALSKTNSWSASKYGDTVHLVFF